MEVALSGERYRRYRLAGGVSVAVMVSGKLCQLRRNLWFARSRDRHDDLDVDVIDRYPRGRGT